MKDQSTMCIIIKCTALAIIAIMSAKKAIEARKVQQ